MLEEEELAIDPAFFYSLRDHFRQIAHIQVEPKLSRHANEMTRYRYDVTCHLASGDRTVATSAWLDWHKDKLSRPAIREILKQSAPESLGIKRIPNAHLTKDLRALELFGDSQSLQTVDDLRRALGTQQVEGMSPDEALSLGAEGSYSVQVQWAGTGSDNGCYHVLFQRQRSVSPGAFPTEQHTPKPWRQYVNNPLLGTYSRKLVPELRRFLQKQVPDYMVPSAFVLMEGLPLLPNGKLDWQALPRPDRANSGHPYTAPRSAFEEVLAMMYADVLATEQVGIDDNFFTTLGGHSLLATQLVSRIRDIFQIDLPLRVVFDKPTVRELTGELLRDTSGRARMEKVADVLLTVANQSDAEIERELAKKSATISNDRAD
jgi:hypothetical protein